MSSPGTPLERYAASLRRPRVVYTVASTVLIVVFASIFAVVWATGSAAHATLHTVGAAPANLPLGTPSAQQTTAWSTTDQLAHGIPQWQGTLITYDSRTVRGRNARTGAVTWSYTRSDRTICAAAQLSGYTVAVYDRDGDCDEADAFDSATGQRAWTRTLDQNGQPVDGRPAFQWTPQTFLVTTASVVYAIDPVSGLNRWTYTRYGCTIDRAVLGSAGALISQDCGNKVVCAGITYCAKGHQLFLRDGTDATLDQSKPNFDQITWSRTGYTGVPATAATLVSAVLPGSSTLDVLSPATGAVVRTVPLDPAPGSLSGSASAATVDVQVLWSNGHAYAAEVGGSTTAWVATATGPATVIDAAGDSPPPTAQARVTVPTADGISTLDASTGAVTGRYRVPAPPAGSTVVPLGTGFAVGSGAGTVVYR